MSGGLHYVSLVFRPDISFGVNVLDSSARASTFENHKLRSKVIKYLEETQWRGIHLDNKTWNSFEIIC